MKHETKAKLNLETLLRKYLCQMTLGFDYTLFDDHVIVFCPIKSRKGYHIELYVREQGDGFTIDDNGSTIRDLREDDKYEQNTKKIESILYETRVGCRNNKLYVTTNDVDFDRDLANLLRAVIAIDMLPVIEN